MKPVNLAVIGGGVIGKRHIKAISETPHVRLTAIVDPHPSAVDLAAQCNVPWFADSESLFADTDAEGVIVATPTEHHQAPTLLALDAGRHVLVEKPIMATVQEAQAVIERSVATSRHVLVGHHRRYYTQVHRARELIQQGALGQLVAVTGQWNMHKHAEYYQPDWRKSWKAGPVLTNLIHEIDTLRYLCGDIESLSAETANRVQGFEKEDVAALVMRFSSGTLGTFILSDQTNSPWSWELATGENASFPATHQNSIRFMGTQGSLDFPNLVLWQHAETPGDWNKLIQADAISIALEDAYINQVNHFASVIRGDETPRISARDATDTLKATLAVYEAADTGRRVMVS